MQVVEQTEVRPIDISLVFQRGLASYEINTILHPSVSLDANLSVWIQQLCLDDPRSQKFESLRDQLYKIEINGK